ncbi:MAG: hypothetical protein HKN45_09530 [Flavobacteriales bacterium]|nr:hypothetical protein [Flavobacteriales bacterium]
MFASLFSSAQVTIEHLTFKVNNLGQYQVLSTDGVDLYSAKGVLLKHYSEDLLGEVTSLDRSSSLESLLFYEDIPAFQILDNTLSPHGRLYDLNLADLQNVTIVCMSNDNTFWAYDAVTLEMLRFDNTFKILERSGNLAVIIGREIKPNSMLVSGDRVYLADEIEGLFVFDLFANFLIHIPFEGLVDFDVVERWIYMTDGKVVERIDNKGMRSQVLDSVIEESILCLDIEANSIYLGDGNIIRKRLLNSLFH